MGLVLTLLVNIGSVLVHSPQLPHRSLVLSKITPDSELLTFRLCHLYFLLLLNVTFPASLSAKCQWSILVLIYGRFYFLF